MQSSKPLVCPYLLDTLESQRLPYSVPPVMTTEKMEQSRPTEGSSPDPHQRGSCELWKYTAIHVRASRAEHSPTVQGQDCATLPGCHNSPPSRARRCRCRCRWAVRACCSCLDCRCWWPTHRACQHFHLLYCSCWRLVPALSLRARNKSKQSGAVKE